MVRLFARADFGDRSPEFAVATTDLAFALGVTDASAFATSPHAG